MNLIFIFLSSFLIINNTTVAAAAELPIRGELSIQEHQQWEKSYQNEIQIQIGNGSLTPEKEVKDLEKLAGEIDQAFLSFNSKLVESKTNEFLSKLLETAFSPNTAKSFQNVVYTGILSIESPDLSEEYKQNILGFAKSLVSSEKFKKELPNEVKDQILNEKKTQSAETLGYKKMFPDFRKDDQAFIGSRFVSWEFKAPYYLETKIVLLNKDGRLEAKNGKQINLLRLNQDQLIKVLKNTAPSSIKDRDLSLITKDGPINIFQKSKPALNKAQKPVNLNLNSRTQNPVDQIDWQIDRIPPLGEDYSEKKSFFQSPWFWVAVGAVTGGAGYLIYDQTRTKTVNTP